MSFRNVWVACVATVFLASCGSDAASPDASISDANSAIDAVVECTTDGQCNDGLFCNGVETCSLLGLCQSGEAVECNDGIPCTVDICSNERKECVSAAPDVDDDGHGDASCLDTSGVSLGDDCDDLDINRFPGNVEFCDAEHHDEDCDASTFGVIDVDDDGYASAGCCNTNDEGTLVCGADCDDNRANVNRNVADICDGLDNNCDGNVDEGVTVSGYVDNDGDGFGDTNQPISQCAGLAHFATEGGDCDDEDPAKNPGQIEICDSIDNDCNDLVDDNTQDVDWYLDVDGDGFGDANGGVIVSCAPIEGRSVLGTDCDDTAAGINPGSQELCDGLDNDCNGSPDFQIGVNDFEDDDGDGLVDIACAPLGTDCDDTNPITGPGTVEQCDGQDNDCDGLIDENVVQTLWFRDNDSDGYGSVVSGTLVSCSAPLGYTVAGGDCDDSDEARNPSVTETCNGDDDDCDSAVDEVPAVSSCPARPNSTEVCSEGGCGFGCDTGYSNCDGSAASGCEALVASDSNNCGSCGTTCNAGNQSGTCTGGQCLCVDGFADCDGNPANGCETNLASDPDDCGFCGNTCSFQNAMDDCVAGECTIQTCLPDFDDCDATLGCETNVTTDTQCGSCNNDCTAIPNTSAFCTASGPGGSQCIVNGCIGSFQDCENFTDDGCESNTDTDSQHCGGCNNNCSQLINADGTCSAGVCGCTGNFITCDQGDCQTDSQTDVQNCGGCGIDCNQLTGGSGFCDAGTCRASCFGGQGDCDANPLDCETDFTANDNCGECGTSCTPITNGFSSCQDFGGGYTCNSGCDNDFQDCDAEPGTCESNRLSDADNCNGCGNSCGTAGICTGGGCDQIKSLTVGENFSCVLRDSGGIACWGNNVDGQLGNSEILPAVSVASPTAVDATTMGQANELASGSKHSCAAAVTGTFCWGDNDMGQLGTDTAGVASSTPLRVPGIQQFSSLAMGVAHSCAVDISDSSVYCWGGNSLGQLGQGTIDAGGVTPLQIPGLPNIDRIVAGDNFTCAYTFAQDVFCWGAGTDGQLGDGLSVDNPTPVQVAGVADRIALGSLSACRAVAGGALECWGDDTFLQIGNGAPAVDESLPTGTGLSSVMDVLVGAAHACMQTDTGGLYCWGDNSVGQAGQGDEVGPIPTALPVNSLGNTVTQLARGTSANHVCVLTSLGAVQCWGSNSDGQVGVDPAGSGPTVSLPTPVLGL